MSELALLPIPSQLASAYASLITPLLNLLQTSLTQLTTRVKKSLQRNAFLALAAYAQMSRPEITRHWDDTVRQHAGGAASNANVNVLKEGLHSLRAVCLRSFPEFLADIKMAAAQGASGELGTDIAEIAETVSTQQINIVPLTNQYIKVIKYMVAVPAVQDAVGTALLTLGDGNWKMGEGVPMANKGPKLGEGDENVIIEHYFCELFLQANDSHY